MLSLSLLLTVCIFSNICKSGTPSPTLPKWIDTVHLVVSNHFDCGFAGIDPALGFATAVVNKYFNVYFPAAIETGFTLENDYNLTFTWMTQSFLISLFFDCPLHMGLNCPNQTAKDYVQLGINKRFIYWHAFPFNSQQEVYDKSMLEFGLILSKDLSSKYNAPISQIVSQRDVPGFTRSVIPTLIDNNITTISVGVNTGSSPPNVPRIFRWKDVNSNQMIIGMSNPGGYGSVNFPDPVYLNNWNEALAFAWNGDNQGPPTSSQVVGFYQTLEQEFPNAKIFASTITNFVRNLLADNVAVESLPIVDSEIGDTWTHGIQSDPWKTAVNRIAQRHRAECLNNGNCSLSSNAFYNFSRLLLKNGEHTWGGDIKAFLDFQDQSGPYYAWSNVEFQKSLALNDSNNKMTNFRSTWYEQRNWGINYSLEALSLSNKNEDIQLYTDIMNEINEISNPLSPLLKDDKQWKLVDVNDNFMVISVYDGRQFSIKFDAKSGALMELKDVTNGNNVSYASNTNLIGEFIYQTMTGKDFDTFMNNYAIILPPPWWMQGDFGKNELDQFAHPIHQYITASFKNLYQSSTYSNEFLVEMIIGQNEIEQKNLTKYYGIPQTVFNYVSFNNDKSTLSMIITWINKTATRIPEDIYLRFNPVDCINWNVEKFEEFIHLNNIVKNGTMHMHNIVGKAFCSNKDDNNIQFNVIPIDSGLSVFMTDESNEFSAFPTPLTNATDNGIGFVLYDNTWGTNYPIFWPFDPSNVNTTYRFDILL